MARIELSTELNIFQRLVNRVVARTNLSDISDTSVFKQLLRAVAAEIAEGHFQLNLISLLNDIDQASGSDLDEVARRIVPNSLTRFAARRAVGRQSFRRVVTTSDETVPAGFTFQGENGLSYSLLAPATATAGNEWTGVVPARAQLAGSNGNAAAGTVTVLSSRFGNFIETTNNSSYRGGRALETDDAFRGRIRSYVASLARCQPAAIEALVFGLVDPITGLGVTFASLDEDFQNLGNSTLYIDDGTGSAKTTRTSSPTGTITGASSDGTIVTATVDIEDMREALVGRTITITGTGAGTFTILDTPNADEVIYDRGVAADPVNTDTFVVSDDVFVTAASEGQQYAYSSESPIDEASTITVTSDIRGALTPDVDYFLDSSQGLFFFDPALRDSEEISAKYQVLTGILERVSRVVNGESRDRANFPGLRAAGTRVRVDSPTLRIIEVEAKLTVVGRDRASTILDVKNAVSGYIDNLTSGGDIIRNEIIDRIMGVAGVYDVSLIKPAERRIVVLRNEIPRTSASLLNIS